MVTPRDEGDGWVRDKRNDYYLLYEINNIKKVLPEKNIEFIESVKFQLFEINKYEYNKNLLLKIQNKLSSNLKYNFA